MSFIAVEGLPQKWSLIHVVKILKPVIAGHFEPLRFVPGPGKLRKTCHLRLSDKHDPVEIVEKINSKATLQKVNIIATILEEVSDIPPTSQFKIPQKMARALKIQTEQRPEQFQILTMTQMEILVEMQSKFTGLFNLSRKTPGHQLLGDIAWALFERLYGIMETNTEAATSCFNLSKAYRKLHPHFADFQLVLSHLHAGQNRRGEARSDLTEDMLSVPHAQPYSIDNIPYDKIQAATSKYSLKITKKMLEHIRSLKADVDVDTDSEEEVARKRVRHELQNVAQYLPSMIRQVIQKHLSPEKSPFNRMRIYGEPYLPSVEQLSPLLRRHRAVKILRSDRMYNLLKCSIPPDQYTSLLGLDGTSIGNAKLVIRSSDIPLFKVPDALLAEMKTTFGIVSPTDHIDNGDDHEETLIATD